MDIVVCIKQVPATNNVNICKDTNTIVREGVKGEINPFDMYAIEEALKIKEEHGGKVTAISMGILTAVDQLREAIALGVDEAVLLSDKNFAGSDTLATSYVLSAGIKKTGNYQLIICGRQAVDGDTAQVGPALAEKLGIPHVTCVKKIEDIREGYIRCQRMTDKGYEIIEMELPALITVMKDINDPRLPTIKGIMKAKKACIRVWTADEIDVNKELCGLKGSPTQVVKTFVPEYSVQREVIEGRPEDQARQLVDRLAGCFSPLSNK